MSYQTIKDIELEPTPTPRMSMGALSDTSSSYQ